MMQEPSALGTGAASPATPPTASRQPGRVLMLCYYYPPIRSAGTHRSVAFARGLASLGWEPVVLTVATHRDPNQAVGEPIPDDVRVQRAYELNLYGTTELLQGITNRLLRSVGKELPAHFFRDLCVPDPQIGWFSWRSGRRLARQADCIYASCSPFSSALAALHLGRVSGRPVVVDFRDAWLLNPHNVLGGRRRRLVAALERRVVIGAARVILNTEGAGRLYRQAYPDQAGKFIVIPNGYDALAPSAGIGVRTGDFRIVHVGSFYGRRTVEPLLEALARIGRQDVVLVHAGPKFSVPPQYAGGVNIRQLGHVSRQEALATMQDASLLYLKQAHEDGVRDYVAVASKTYEYLGTGLPVLADCPDGDNVDIVRTYCRAPFVVTSGRVDDLEAAIREALAQRAQVPIGVSERFVHDFDRRRLTGALARVLSDAMGVEERA